MDHILLLRGDPELAVNPNEVANIKFLARDELDAFLKDENSLIWPWFRLFATSLLPQWWDQLEKLSKADAQDKTIHRYY